MSGASSDAVAGAGPELTRLVEEMVERKLDEELRVARELVRELDEEPTPAPADRPRSGITLVAFSGDLDRIHAALTLATTTAALGKPATVFFASWGVAAVRSGRRYRGKSFREKLASFMLPAHIGGLGTSRMNFFGLGPVFFRSLMKEKGMPGLSERLQTARELGVRLVVCGASMEMLGIREDEVLAGLEIQGAASCFVDLASAEVSLFV